MRSSASGRPGAQRQLLFNALAAVVYTTAQTVVGLGIYAYLIRALGAEEVGVWVSLMAVGMIACMSDLALNQSLLRLVALSQGPASDDQDASATMETLLLSTAMLVGVAFTAVYLSFGWWSGWLNLSGKHFDMAQALLPWMCLGLWFNRLADAMGGALEGMQRYVARCTAGTVAFLLGLSLTLLSVPRWGLHGAAIAFATQNAFLVLVNLLLLHRAQPGLRWWRPRFRWAMVRQAVRYGTSLQGMVLVYALLESGCKLILTRHGFLAVASYFDLAFRIGKGLRALLASALRVLVPRIVARMHIEGQPQVIYSSSFSLITAVSIPMYMSLLACADLVSWAVIGEVDRQFMTILGLASIPWLAYCFIDPALNQAMAVGRMGWALTGHMLKVLLAMLLVMALPVQSSPESPVAVVAASMVAGCTWMLITAHRREQLSWAALSPGVTAITLAGSLMVAVWSSLDVNQWSREHQQWHTISRFCLVLVMPALIIAWHPGGQRIVSALRSIRPAKVHEVRA